MMMPIVTAVHDESIHTQVPVKSHGGYNSEWDDGWIANMPTSVTLRMTS